MLRPSRILIAALILIALNIPVRAQPMLPPIDARWADLASPDEGKATRALLALAATPKETLAFLQYNLKAVKVGPRRVEQLLKALDSDTFAVRHQATVELEYYGKYIKSELESALKGDGKLETRMRIQQLLDKMPKDVKKEEPKPAPKAGPGKSVSVTNINGQITILVDGQPINMAPATPIPPPSPPAQWLRATKAVLLLEHLATPEARAILQSLAGGESDALPTVAAREALERLRK